MFSFNSQFVKTDVTSVKILRDHYLVGTGGYLNIFDRESFVLISKINVFEGQKIYGIVHNEKDNKILLYGGKYISIISVDKDFQKINELCKMAPDWILAAKWIDFYDNIATVSMNNRFQIWTNDLELITEVNCEEKCILYSAFICFDKPNELVVLSGTVFSEVLIWKPDKIKGSPVLKRLQKHKGVIFSVHYSELSGTICSSSDDRSAVLWLPKSRNLLTELQKENIEIKVLCQVFGHSARIFRCMSLFLHFLTAGEDSLINVWSLRGELVKKIDAHQGGPIWAVDANEMDNIILTGGSDGGVSLFTLYSNIEEKELTVPNNEVPKITKILFHVDAFVVFCESGSLYLCERISNSWTKIAEHYDLKSYALMEVSKYRHLIALAGIHGQIYIYVLGKYHLEKIISFQTQTRSRIFALHWIDCESFFICEDEGRMTFFLLRDNSLMPAITYILPPSRERWSTTANFMTDHFVIGDRRGNVHLFEFGLREPVQTLKKVHNHLGVTKLITRSFEVISLGRNAVIKKFVLDDGTLKLTSSNKVPFKWLVDIIDDLLLAFSGDKFVLWDMKRKRLLFEKPCGGGHRSWDYLAFKDSVTFFYIKDKVIHAVDVKSRISYPYDLINGYHVKEINSVQAFQIAGYYVVVSGGEDTTLRVNLNYEDMFLNIIALKPHLSSIRTITIHKISENSDENKGTCLIFSGGGRAQIICWKLEVFIENDLFKELFCTEQHSYYKVIDNEESETRIMHLTTAVIGNQLFLFAACSDGNVQVFYVIENDNKFELQLFRDIFYKLRCILKLCLFNVFSRDILVTMATDGNIVFWDVSNITTGGEIIPFYTVKSHQSGINSYDFRLLEAGSFVLFLTGGDDNAVVLNLFEFKPTDNAFIENIDTFTISGTHCAQVTGVFLSDAYFLTAAIDQRVTVFQWQLLDKKLTCKQVALYNTVVSDIQGLCCFSNNCDFDLFVYGKGIEHIKVEKKT